MRMRKERREQVKRVRNEQKQKRTGKRRTGWVERREKVERDDRKKKHG